MEMRKHNETMIIRGGRLIYAITLAEKVHDTDGRESRTSYIYIEDGKVKFADGWIERHQFDFNEESHRLAKEIFITELQTDIKRRILELKQLQSIFDELNLSECFGSVLADNTRLLLEVREQVEQVSNVVQQVVTAEDVEAAIVESIAPIALTKEGRKKKKTSKVEKAEQSESTKQSGEGEGC